MRNWAIAGASLAAGLLGAGLYSARVARKAEEQVPMDGRLVEAGGTLLHVTEQGEGPPLLLIHGLGAQLASISRGWSAIRLAARSAFMSRSGMGIRSPAWR